MTAFRLAAVGLIVVLHAGVSSAQVVITDLGLVGTATSTSGVAINNTGQVAGQSSAGTQASARPVVWTNGAGVELPQVCPGCLTISTDINDAGEVVGWGLGPSGQIAFHWHNGVQTILPPLPGGAGAMANSINNDGVIVGGSGSPSGGRPVRWINGVPENLGLLGSSGFGGANAINDAGDIVGSSSTNTGETHAFILRNGVMTDLGRLPGGACPASSSATGVNEHGQVVGTSNVDCQTRAVTWINGVLQQLPQARPDTPVATAMDINDHGDIVGNAGLLLDPRAVLWRGGQVILLGSLGPSGQGQANDINESGVIAGGTSVGAVVHAATYSTTPPNTAPTLNLPGGITVDADTANGANVFFTATANDAEDGSFNASCFPASGTEFPIGVTTVSCTAVDTGGLDATGTFDVTVNGAFEQAQSMVQTLGSSGPGNSLQQKLDDILALLAPQVQSLALQQQTTSNAQVCSRLQPFINQVAAQAGKKLTLAQAAALIAAANRIRAIAGCN